MPTPPATQSSRNVALTRSLSIPTPLNPTWPVLTRYDADHLARVALPLGGIGTGTVSLGGRGDLRDFELVNKPAKGYEPANTFFALYAKPAAGPAVSHCLEGPLDPALTYEGASGSPVKNHGLPRFRHAAFAAAYPLGQVLLHDTLVPLDVRIEAFNPLVPGDADASGIPAAVLRFVLINRGSEAVSAAVCGSIENFIGFDGSTGVPNANVNDFRPAGQAGSPAGVFLRSDGISTKHPAYGTMAICVVGPGGAAVTHRTAWEDLSWGGALLDFWEDFSSDGRLEDRPSVKDPAKAPMASLAAAMEVPPGESRALTFLFTWHFPNRLAWTPGRRGAGAERIGNYYTTTYKDAWDAAVRTAAELPKLEENTIEFVRAFCSADLPPVVKEAALYNTSTLRTPTCFRTEDGKFFGWEGCNDKAGCCHGSCTHVWNYEQATAFLFAALSRSMQETEFGEATAPSGLQSFRVNLPLAHANDFARAAADGQTGTIIRLYRDWQLAGDDEWLKKLWPGAKRSLEFAWKPGSWDADRDGVMEGCQHNTMDVEYYGPNPQMQGWYLGALRAAEEMARHLGEADFANTCRDLYLRGRAWADAHLFNGDYYEHLIQPPAHPNDPASVAPGLRVGMGATDPAHPDLQLGAGCLVDQLVGQYMAHVCGLGHLLDPAHVRKTLSSVFRYNFRRGFHGFFNNMRSYVLGDESGLLMATYPKGRRPKRPFPYFGECMTGFEYTAAAGMMYEAMAADPTKPDATLMADAITVISAVRDRYDGRKRSPFDEAECGHHYARAMAAWAAVLALTGFHYSAVTQSITFAATAKPSTFFFSTGAAWGTFHQSPAATGADVTLTPLHGSLTLRRLTLRGIGTIDLPMPITADADHPAHFTVPRQAPPPA